MKDPVKIRKHFANKLTKLLLENPEVVKIEFENPDIPKEIRLNEFTRLRDGFTLRFYTRNIIWEQSIQDVAKEFNVPNYTIIHDSQQPKS